MEMHDLFFLTLQVIVYIPYLVARGKAVQVKRGNEKEWGMCSKTATAINLRHPGNHTYTYDEQCFFFPPFSAQFKGKEGSIVCHMSGK